MKTHRRGRGRRANHDEQLAMRVRAYHNRFATMSIGQIAELYGLDRRQGETDEELGDRIVIEIRARPRL